MTSLTSMRCTASARICKLLLKYQREIIMLSKRQFLQGVTACASAFSVPGVFAQALEVTRLTGDGPFYPDRMPLDTDNDLLIINDAITPAVGEITHLTGRLLTASGSPVRNAFIEIWEADMNGSYIHTEGRNDGKIDGNFQGYGRFLTDAEGRYYFRTIKPTSYTLVGQFRAPHIHVAVSKAGQRIMATQALVKGHPDNARDLLLDRFPSPGALDTLMVEYRPLPGSTLGELTANFDIVLGRTAEELEDGSIGGIGQPG
jgi:protocatechuate 3,4-dioxygenase beta subunit